VLLGFCLPPTGSVVTVPRPLRIPSPRRWPAPGMGNSTHMTVNDGDDARLHGRGHVPVAQADRAAAPVLSAAGVVAHQLINHAGGDAAVLQPGREWVSG
jgi:hypothetical protein